MNLKELAKSKGTNVKQLAEKCGVPASTLYAISSGDTNMDNIGIDLFLKISAGLEMSAEELRNEMMGVEMRMVPQGVRENEPSLSPDEQHLIALYRNMDREHRDVLMQTARAFSALSEKDGAAERGAVLVGAVDAVS